jgi:DNA-directed RNA polymerase specialized sigma24 family protein
MMQDVAESGARGARTYERTAATRRVEIETDQNRRWAAWIRCIADGDMDALAAFYDESSRLVFSLVLHILQDRETADETLIGIYHRVRQEAHMFADRDEIASVWLITLARNAAVQRLRAASDARFELFKQREHQSIIQMTYFGGFTAEEVADLMGLSLEYVRRQIVVAMNKLRGPNSASST